MKESRICRPGKFACLSKTAGRSLPTSGRCRSRNLPCEGDRSQGPEDFQVRAVSGAEGQTVEAGVAESLDGRGNPRSPLGESHLSCLSYFVSLCLILARLIASANTGI